MKINTSHLGWSKDTFFSYFSLMCHVTEENVLHRKKNYIYSCVYWNVLAIFFLKKIKLEIKM